MKNKKNPSLFQFLNSPVSYPIERGEYAFWYGIDFVHSLILLFRQSDFPSGNPVASLINEYELKMDLILNSNDKELGLDFFLYKNSLNEKSADMTGLKNTNKIFKANKKLKLTNINDVAKIESLNDSVLSGNYKIDVEELDFDDEKDEEQYEIFYYAEKNANKIAELNALGSVLKTFHLTQTDVYRMVNKCLIDYIKTLKWNEETVKEIYDIVIKLNLKTKKLDYSKAIKKFYHNNYEKQEELTK